MFYKIVISILKVLVFFIFDLKIHNSDNINNSKGGYIVCGNHKSMIDPVIAVVSSKRMLRMMGKKELFENKILSYIFRSLGGFPVDRKGISMSAIKTSLEILKNGELLCIFPEGTRVKNGFEEVNAKPGIAMIANKAKVKIIPFYIKGDYKFRGKIDIYFGSAKDYFENYEENINSQTYSKIGVEVLRDIYSLDKGEV